MYSSSIKADASNEYTSSEAIPDTAIEKESLMETTCVANPAESSPLPFKHIALDHGIPSMRLIRLRPNLSPDGQIECEIKQSTMDSTYVCLSYVWGDQDSGEFILIDGRSHWVGQNLFSFLKYARRKKHLRNWLWIDALCIDQANLAERTHQVQYMGQIYSGAEQVVSWLGPEKDIASFLISLRQRQEEPGNSKQLRAFCRCEYWNRAWITQEVALARRLTLMARNVEVSVDDELSKHFVTAFEYIPSLDASMTSIEDLFDLHLAPIKSLIPLRILLPLFQKKQCAIPRDRIFSVLALASEGPHVNADYEATNEALAFRILEAQDKKFRLSDVYTMMKCLEIPHVRPSRSDRGAQVLKKTLPVQKQPVTWMHQMVACDITESTIETQVKKWRYREGNTCTEIVNASMEHVCTIVEIDLSCPLLDGRIAMISYPDYSSGKYTLGRYKSRYIQKRNDPTMPLPVELYFPLNQETCNVEVSLGLDCRR